MAIHLKLLSKQIVLCALPLKKHLLSFVSNSFTIIRWKRHQPQLGGTAHWSYVETQIFQLSRFSRATPEQPCKNRQSGGQQFVSFGLIMENCERVVWKWYQFPVE